VCSSDLTLALVALLALPDLQPAIQWPASMLVLWTLIDFAARIEKRKWVLASESLRLVAIAAFAGSLV